MLVPDGWINTNIGSCVIGSTLRNAELKFSHNDLRAVNKIHGMIPMKDQVKAKSVERAKIVQKGWFAYNPMRLNIGSICRWDKEFDCIVSPDYVVFYCNDSLLTNDYFNQFRCSHRWKQFMDDAGNGSVRIRIYLNDLKLLSCVLPPLSEQKAIAKILSTWDKGIEQLTQLIEARRQRKKALMQRLLTGKQRLAGFDEQWRQTPLEEITDVIVSNVDKKSHLDEIPIRLCNYTDVYHNNYINNNFDFMQATATQSEIKKFRLKPNDVVITKDSESADDIAVPALIAEPLEEVICGYHLAILRPHTTQASGAFLCQIFSLPTVRYYFFTLANGATRFGLSISAIAKAKLNLPPLKEQTSIAAILSAADSELSQLEQKLAAYKEQKKGLMQQLLTGKKRLKINHKEAA